MIFADLYYVRINNLLIFLNDKEIVNIYLIKMNTVKAIVGLSTNATTDASSLYPNYPLNLLHDINTLVNSELLIVVILINMFVVQYILTQDYTKYIPDNKFGRFVNFFLSRYIKVYSQSNKFIIGFCVLNLIVCIFFSKLFLYFIMNPS